MIFMAKRFGCPSEKLNKEIFTRCDTPWNDIKALAEDLSCIGALGRQWVYWNCSYPDYKYLLEHLLCKSYNFVLADLQLLISSLSHILCNNQWYYSTHCDIMEQMKQHCKFQWFLQNAEIIEICNHTRG